MSVQIKAFLYEDKPSRPKEIRRFVVDQDVSSNYDYLRRKVSTVFPNLGEDNYALQWRDTDGDLIWFNSDEELMQALGQLDTDVFRLYIKENAAAQNSDSQGHGRRPGCGQPWNFSSSCRPGFAPWMAAPPPQFAPFGPRFGGQCPFFPQPQQSSNDTSSSDKKSEPKSTGCKDGQQQQQSQGQGPAENYLQNVGNAVADFLQPFGIDVDINVEHKGQQKKCSGTRNTSSEDKKDGSDEAESSEERTHARDSPDETDWTFLKKGGDKSEGESQGKDEKMETDSETALKEALAQLKEMGFNDNGEWLSNLLRTFNNDISRVLEAMQPAQGYKK